MPAYQASKVKIGKLIELELILLLTPMNSPFLRHYSCGFKILLEKYSPQDFISKVKYDIC